jgi:hypothetical protein
MDKVALITGADSLTTEQTIGVEEGLTAFWT